MIRETTVQLRSTSSAITALSVAFLLFSAAAPTQAQSAFVTGGHGRYVAFNQVDTLRFNFFVAAQAGGAAQGYALWRGPDSIILWQVTSAMTLGQTVAFAGPVVWTHGSPPPGYVVGAQAFTAVNDNGPGSADDIASISVLPQSYGNPTIQQIIAIAGPPPALPAAPAKRVPGIYAQASRSRPLLEALTTRCVDP